jgi:CRP/FNR family transcriptional regulator
MLFVAGAPVAKLQKIVSGVAALSVTMPDGRRQIVDFLFPGDICGFIQSRGSHMFDCEAITEATTCAVDVSRLRKLTVAYSNVDKAIDEEMALAVNRMAENVVAVGQLGTLERRLHFLRWLEEAYAKRGMPTQPLALPMSRSDIGDYLGMRLETVSRAFAKLKEQGLIELPSFERVVLHRQRAASRLLK